MVLGLNKLSVKLGMFLVVARLPVIGLDHLIDHHLIAVNYPVIYRQFHHRMVDFSELYPLSVDRIIKLRLPLRRV
jgi:hypothetical protein